MAPADPGTDLEVIAGQLLAQLPAGRGQVALARLQPTTRRPPPAAARVAAVADQQGPAGTVEDQTADGLPDRVDGDVGGDLHDQAARPPVGQPGHPAGRRHQRGQPREVLVLGRPGLRGHGHRHAQPAGVADGVPQPGRQPPGVPVAPAPLVGAAPVQARAEQKSTTAAPPAAASVQGKSTSPSAQRVTPNRAAPSWNTPAPSPVE